MLHFVLYVCIGFCSIFHSMGVAAAVNLGDDPRPEEIALYLAWFKMEQLSDRTFEPIKIGIPLFLKKITMMTNDDAVWDDYSEIIRELGINKGRIVTQKFRQVNRAIVKCIEEVFSNNQIADWGFPDIKYDSEKDKNIFDQESAFGKFLLETYNKFDSGSINALHALSKKFSEFLKSTDEKRANAVVAQLQAFVNDKENDIKQLRESMHKSFVNVKIPKSTMPKYETLRPEEVAVYLMWFRSHQIAPSNPCKIPKIGDQNFLKKVVESINDPLVQGKYEQIVSGLKSAKGLSDEFIIANRYVARFLQMTYSPDDDKLKDMDDFNVDKSLFSDFLSHKNGLIVDHKKALSTLVNEFRDFLVRNEKLSKDDAQSITQELESFLASLDEKQRDAQRLAALKDKATSKELLPAEVEKASLMSQARGKSAEAPGKLSAKQFKNTQSEIEPIGEKNNLAKWEFGVTPEATAKAYKILGLNENDTLENLASVYRQLALKRHPDKNSDAKAAAQFQELNDAYKYLEMEKVKKDKNDREEEASLIRNQISTGAALKAIAAEEVEKKEEIKIKENTQLALLNEEKVVAEQKIAIEEDLLRKTAVLEEQKRDIELKAVQEKEKIQRDAELARVKEVQVAEEKKLAIQAKPNLYEAFQRENVLKTNENEEARRIRQEAAEKERYLKKIKPENKDQNSTYARAAEVYQQKLAEKQREEAEKADQELAKALQEIENKKQQVEFERKAQEARDAELARQLFLGGELGNRDVSLKPDNCATLKQGLASLKKDSDVLLQNAGAFKVVQERLTVVEKIIDEIKNIKPSLFVKKDTKVKEYLQKVNSEMAVGGTLASEVVGYYEAMEGANDDAKRSAYRDIQKYSFDGYKGAILGSAEEINRLLQAKKADLAECKGDSEIDKLKTAITKNVGDANDIILYANQSATSQNATLTINYLTGQIKEILNT